MTKKVIMIILDGFSSTYLKRHLCPKMCDLAVSNFLSKVKPMFGFQGVGAAIYSGASSNVTGIFTEFILEKNEFISRSQFLQILLKISDRLPSDDLCLNSRALLFKLMHHRTGGISNLIPPQILAQFSPKLKKSFTNNNSLGKIRTIFDILRENQMSFQLQKPSPRLEKNAFHKTINCVKNGTLPDLTVIHPCSLDIIGHNFGPFSPRIGHVIANMDVQMSRIIKCVESSKDETMIVILSDHGMSPVNNCINLSKLLKQLPIMLGKDYLVFLDSTIARFWFFNDRAENLVKSTLSTVNSGKILDLQDKKELGIEKVGPEYGELIFAINEGTVIFPDFFRKYSSPKGMHGYAFSRFDTPILAFCHPKLRPNWRIMPTFVDVMPTILGFFELSIPQNCEGMNLLI